MFGGPLQMASAGGQSLSLSSNVPLLNYQPGLYQQATINIPGLGQQSRATQLCGHTEPFQQTLIVCPPTIQGNDQSQLLLWCPTSFSCHCGRWLHLCMYRCSQYMFNLKFKV